MKYLRFYLHRHLRGDKEITGIMHKIFQSLHKDLDEVHGFEHFDDTFGSNRVEYKIPEETGRLLMELSTRVRALQKEEFKKGKAAGTDLLTMLNNNEITTEDFIRRSQ